jgi:hypothetical protein
MPTDWSAFIAAYRTDGHFQYFPHAHVGTDRFPAIVEVLATFEGQPWDDAKVMGAVRRAKLTSGTTAGARMIRKATENLSFCWFDDHVLWMTPAGKAFIAGTDRTKLLEKLLWSYHLSNPVNDGAVGFDIFPHAALIEILIALPDHRVTRDEFILFVGRCRSEDSIPETIKLIQAWRTESLVAQDAVLAGLGREFDRRVTDSSYVLGFHATASYLERFDDVRRRKGVGLKAGAETSAGDRLIAHRGGARPIEFKLAADFIAFHGDPEVDLEPLANVDYLLDTSQWNRAIAAFKKLPPSLRGGISEAEFEEAVFLEKDLEDYLVKHLALIEKGLKLVKRQYRIEIGAIDLLCRSANGDAVVIELKKVRASDKVFGQLCRYIGCIRAHHAKPRQVVRGYIIGSEIDDKLRYAASVAPKGIVELKTFRRDPANSAIFIEG